MSFYKQFLQKVHNFEGGSTNKGLKELQGPNHNHDGVLDQDKYLGKGTRSKLTCQQWYSILIWVLIFWTIIHSRSSIPN